MCRYTKMAILVIAIGSLALSDAGSQPVIGEEDCVDCSDCMENGEHGNKAPDGDHSSLYDRGGGSHTNCITSGGCGVQHPYNFECPGFQTDNDAPDDPVALLDSIEEAAFKKDARGIERIIASAPDGYLVHVAELDAVQAHGCRGQIIAHIPLGLATN